MKEFWCITTYCISRNILYFNNILRKSKIKLGIYYLGTFSYFSLYLVFYSASLSQLFFFLFLVLIILHVLLYYNHLVRNGGHFLFIYQVLLLQRIFSYLVVVIGFLIIFEEFKFHYPLLHLPFF